MARRGSLFVALALTLAAVLAPLRASADVQACLGASEKGQRARGSGRLREARDLFLVCGAVDCPAMVRRDCTQWQSEVVSMLPSVVFGAKDRGGRDLFDVIVSIDGEIITRKLDGKSLAVDPGPHTFTFEVQGQPPIVERALVKEGEKTRVVAGTFAGLGPSVPANDGGKAVAPPEDRGHTIYPWIVVGAGAATTIAGLVVLFTAPSLPAGCFEATKTCAKAPGESDASLIDRQDKAGRSDAQPVQGLVIGAAGLVVVAGGLLWHFLEPTGPRTRTAGALRFTPWAAPGASGASLSATF